jgi:hypothetical protein
MRHRAYEIILRIREADIKQAERQNRRKSEKKTARNSSFATDVDPGFILFLGASRLKENYGNTFLLFKPVVPSFLPFP